LSRKKELTSIDLQCETLDGKPCPNGSCKGADISLTGVSSDSCPAELNVELRKLNINVDKNGRKIEFLIPHAVIKRPYTWEGHRIPGAGIGFIDYGDALQPLADFITS
jgi:hypothetical protein